MTAINASEQRAHQRFPVVTPYHLILKGKRYDGETGNISLNGAYLETIIPALQASSADQPGELILDLDDQSIILACQIVYVNAGDQLLPNGIGVAFDSHQNDKIALLIDFMKTIMR